MKLLILTQKVNLNDPILGFFHRWIEEFSKYYDKVNVICLEKGEFDLPPNVQVYSLGKEDSESKIKYILRFFIYIWKLRKEYDVVFVHMNQVYVLLGGLLWKLWRKKISLWYVHRQKSLTLLFSSVLADIIFTSSKESFRYPGPKVNYLGHGIDVSKYNQITISERPIKNLLFIGRITPIKNIEVIISALEILNNKYPGEYTGTIVGETITFADKKYKKHLEQIILDQNLKDQVKFAGAKKTPEIHTALEIAWATINTSPTGGMDKVVLESLASNRAVFASNSAFSTVFGEYKDIFLFKQNNAENLALKLEEYGKLVGAREIVKSLSDKVRKEYDITALIGKIMKILNG